jgi:Winged helix-turn helix
VRWRACDLIMRLHEEFGISVSDDTVYRALKELGFSRLCHYHQAALPLPQYSSRGCSGWEARVLVRPACKVAQAHLPMDGVLLASCFGRWASLPRR